MTSTSSVTGTIKIGASFPEPRSESKGTLFDQDAFEKSFAIYSEQVRMGVGVKSIKNISYTDPRFNLYNNLQSDAARFTAFREAQKQRELNDAKTDLDKAKVEKRYKEYQLTEKQAIFANSAAAEQWIGFQENADIYPNVTFRTAGDSDVRTSHRALEGLTVSLNDPFLKTHSTPLDFGCRCQWVQTDEPVNHKDEQYKGYKDTPVGKGFDFNPGIDQTLFSDNAGYYTNATNADARQLYEQATRFVGNLSRNSVREAVKDTQKILKPAKLKTDKPIVLSNSDIKAITSKNHDNQLMRNALLFDIEKVVKEAKLVKTALESDGRTQYDTWYYYAVKGFDNMFLNLVKMKSGEIKLHAITDKIK